MVTSNLPDTPRFTPLGPTIKKQRNSTAIALRLALIAVLLVVIGFYVNKWLAKPSLASLAEQALHAKTVHLREQAASQLAGAGKDAVPHLRYVLSESKDDNVVTTCISGLAGQRDYESMSAFLANLDHESSWVRSRAANAVTHLLGRDHHFPASGDISLRERKKQAMINDWLQYKDSPLFKHNQSRDFMKN